MTREYIMKHPYFSVIIPTHNRKDFLQIAVNSVLNQTFSDYELLIIDDGSTDKTNQLIKELYQNNEKLNYIFQPHQGVSSARNTGIKNAKGEFIVFLDSDDRFCRQKLQVSFDYIKKYPEYKIFHTDEVWYQKGKLLPQKDYHKKPTGFIFEQSLKLCCVSPSTAVVKKEVFSNIGFFDESFPACEDYDFWLRVTSKYPVHLIPQALTIKEGGRSDQQSKKYPAMDKFRIDAIAKLMASNNLTKEQYLLAYGELKNKCYIYIKGAAKRGRRRQVKHYQDLISNLKIHEPATT